jgi:V8-like Glu-specific endopeptidase
MRLSPAVLLVIASSCLAPPGAPTTAAFSTAEVRGGTPDDGGLPEVFMVRVVFDTGMQFGCTATLITSRTLLTAAHCFDPAAGPPGLTRLTDVFVQNTVVAPDKTSPNWLRIDPAHTRLHPRWNASDRLSYDLALAALPSPSTVTPAPASFRALGASDVGTPLTVVGYGLTGVGLSDNGTRRVATLPLKAVTTKHLQLGDGATTGLCNGDSGGPSFIAGRDGRRRVAGVHSYDTSLACDDGLDTRVDLFADFVQQFIRDEEGGATCFEDGLCRAGCSPVDLDCVWRRRRRLRGGLPIAAHRPRLPRRLRRERRVHQPELPATRPRLHARVERVHR